jgi:hypothetical protein
MPTLLYEVAKNICPIPKATQQRGTTEREGNGGQNRREQRKERGNEREQRGTTEREGKRKRTERDNGKRRACGQRERTEHACDEFLHVNNNAVTRVTRRSARRGSQTERVVIRAGHSSRADGRFQGWLEVGRAEDRRDGARGGESASVDQPIEGSCKVVG